MTVQMSSDSSTAVLKIAGDVEVSEADALRAALAAALEREASLNLDLSGVETCDTAGLQLFWSARLSAARAGKPFRVAGMSPAMSEIVDAGGMDCRELCDGI
jgi:anti-anti-sigma factor